MDLAPLMRQRFLDDDGNPLAGGKVWSYLAGTSTPAATYTDRSGSTPNTNPIILDADGYCDIWMGPGYFKFVLTDLNDAVIWTKDNVSLTTNSNQSMPSGGLANTFLKKLSDADYHAAWSFPAKSDVGLGNVDNTSDLNKPISTATQSALDLKANDADLTAHVSDTTGAHAASAISNTPSGNLAATDVQGALNELQSDVDSRATATALSDHLSDTSGSHAASAISNTPSGNLSATDVQAALNELQSDVDGRQPSLPAGTNGQVLSLVSGSPAWIPSPVALPNGGTTGQVLTKNSATDGDAIWANSVGIPNGGSTGQALVKNSGTDQDVSWTTIESGMTVSSVQSLANAAVITLAAVKRQRVKIKSTGGAVSITLPNGTQDGQEVFVQGDDDANPCTIANTGNVVSNGDITFTKYKLQLYIWDSGNTKWVASGGY